VGRGTGFLARLGLGRSEIRLVAYDPGWAAAFRVVRDRLRRVLPKARIEHVGSTAIPGSEAKPILDVSVGLAPGSRLRVDAARSIGLEFRSVSPESAHFVVRDRRGRHIVHVHVNPRDSEAELRLIRFRDYLRAHPDAVQEYAEVKRRAPATTRGRERYTEAKGPFIRGLEGHVQRWARTTAWAPGRTRRRQGPRRAEALFPRVPP
jgi:GrpB-like predicted nucleotidyltransferase (UPF0157 family)